MYHEQIPFNRKRTETSLDLNRSCAGFLFLGVINLLCANCKQDNPTHWLTDGLCPECYRIEQEYLEAEREGMKEG